MPSPATVSSMVIRVRASAATAEPEHCSSLVVLAVLILYCQVLGGCNWGVDARAFLSTATEVDGEG